jgi:RNA polymerase sigma factor (sigma-70 family)
MVFKSGAKVESDEQLALEAQRGANASLLVLAERYYAPIFRYLYRLCDGNRMLAEDMTQNVFLRMQRGLTGYQYPRPFRTWLYSIATNLMRDHWALRDTRDTDTIDVPEQAGEAQHESEAAFIEKEDATRVRAALRGLSELHRQTIVLYYYEELSQSDIAAVLDVPLGTVKSRLFNALRNLREILETSSP